MNSIRFHFKLAISNIRKNIRLYMPHIFAGEGLVAMFYIMLTLELDENVALVAGQLTTIVDIGVKVVALLAIIIVLYTNSFLMKQRKREFGLYNVLGMNKTDIGHILFFENAVSSLISLFSGIILGLVFYKLSTLFICKIIKVNTILGFYISFNGILITLLFFAAIYFMTYIYNKLQIIRLKPSMLLLSDKMGEKEPKVKFIMLILGLAAMGGGYYLALSTNNPLQALETFFIAIILVIIGTYFLFMAGTIALLKFLKSNKKYYYKANHMTAVSGLLYRMKQNAVGLASICILATGVLVMLSTTVCLYAGVKDAVNMICPKDLYMKGHYYDTSTLDKETGKEVQAALIDRVKKYARELDINFIGIETQDYLEAMYIHTEDSQYQNVEEDHFSTGQNIVEFTFMAASEYERITKSKLNLKENQVVCASASNNTSKINDHFSINNLVFENVGEPQLLPIESTLTIFQKYFVVVKDEEVLNKIIEQQPGLEKEYVVLLEYDAENEQIKQFEERMNKEIDVVVSNLSENNTESNGGYHYSFNSKRELYESMYQMVGGFLFLGIMLGFVFVFATAIIIYYKQVSEGYEDRHRYEIMLKVGMSEKEVRKSIRTQIILVFFLPLIVATIHLAAAFKPLNHLLAIFFLPNSSLFLLCTCISVIIFVIIYGLIYSITAKTLQHTIYSCQ